MRKIIYPLIGLLFATNTAHTQVIGTLAGTGTAGFSGDGGPAASAQLNNPWGIAADRSGNIYIADRYNHRIRKIDGGGIITTIAGTGTAGYNGDAMAATAAELNGPTGVATDAAGNLYIADRNNNRIRKVAGGIITTVAGTGTAAYNCNHCAATAAQLNIPRGISVDAFNRLWIADQGNQLVRMMDTAGILHNMAGNTSMGYNGDGQPATAAMLFNPASAVADTASNVYIADVDNERIRKVDRYGWISTIAGTGTAAYGGDGGPATAAQLNEPICLLCDNRGNVWEADGWNHRIRHIAPGGTITTIAGNGAAGFSGDAGSALAASLNHPYGIAFDTAGNLLIADYDNHRIRKVATANAIPGVNATENTIDIYPNPAGDMLHLNLTGNWTSGELKITITDAAGRVASCTKLPAARSIQLPVNLRTGYYAITVQHQSFTATLAFEVQ